MGKLHITSFAKFFLLGHWEKCVMMARKRHEQKAINDSRREAISKTIVLTDAQEKSIDDLYVRSYGKRIPHDWHRHYAAFTGSFDPMFFPELLYIPEFEHFQNMFKNYAEVFADKNVLPLIAKSVGIRTPEVILTSTKGMFRDANYKRIGREDGEKILCNTEKLFCKPSVGSSSGRGCFLVHFQDGVDKFSNRTASEVIDFLGKDFSIQRVVKNHSCIDKIYSNSLNTFRIITYRWKDQIYHVPVIMRMGRGGNYLDNAHAGGIFIAVDDDGRLHKTAFSEFKDEYTEHPDTHLRFDGYEIEGFPKVLIAAKTMHEALPQIGSINWDFALDETGTPVLIEANVSGGGIWVIQKAHGCGPFGEKTAEILRWLRKMEKVKYNQRKNYAFGTDIEEK